jgi:hypothetical protein
MSGHWASSDRRSRLPADWPKRRAATKARAGGRCEGLSFDGEPIWHDQRCNGLGSECDHRSDPDNHDDLQWLNHWCHNVKTQAEATAARPSRTRPQPSHPGVIA